MGIEQFLFLGSALVLLSIVSSKLSHKFAVPALLLFLAIGMLAGSEGPGGIYFDDPVLAKTIGIVALICIIFSGGVNTVWRDAKPIVPQGIILSTIGVFGTALIVGWFAVFFLKFTFLEGMLIGSIISSTDAAAVFSILKSKRISLKVPLKPLLEFESGSNDPMAVFLTISVLQLMASKSSNIFTLIPSFFINMSVGAAAGYVMAKISVFVINRLRLEYTDLYPIVSLSLVFMTYTAAAYLNGNGFLAVYVAALVMSNSDFVQKKTITRFHESVAWMMQIVMFLALGMLVFPSRIVPFILPGMLLAAVLMIAARPISVILCLLPFNMKFRKKLMVSWVGLRGAAPIILATFPLLEGIGKAQDIFYLVFFVVLSSVLVQGTSIHWVSNFLRVSAPYTSKRERLLELSDAQGVDAELTDIIVPYDSEVVGKRIYELHLPERSLIVLVIRNDKFIIPSGNTVIEGGDVLQVLAGKSDLNKCTASICHLKPSEQENES